MRCLLSTIAGCLLLFATKGQSSQCNGTLGENIFVSGDFGSGSANILQTDPGIAPGFQYTTIVPFHDGKYTITNDMGRWPSSWPAWLLIGDHSEDPQGYMMVVNASFTPGIFYEQTIEGLCDNTLYEFSADIINIVRFDVTNHILPNVSFLIDDNEEFTTGQVPQNEAWKTYGFTFSTQPGQEKVKLTLRNNAPGGIGNDLALDNISFRPCGPTSTITIDMEGRVCENALYPTLSAIVASDTGFIQWQISTDLGSSWSDIAGATNYTYQSVQLNAHKYLFRYLYGNALQHLQNDKCRIVSASKLVEVVPVYFTIVDTLCEGMNFNLGGTLYATSGTYTEHLSAANGCDSIVTLYLTIVPDPGIQSDLSTMPPLCTGANDGQISVNSIHNGVPPYLLSIEGQSEVPADLSLYVSAGAYQVVVSDRYGCQDVHQVDIEDPFPFVVKISGEQVVILGHTLFFQLSGNYPIEGVQWYPIDGLSCNTCISIEATPLTTTNYVATATSENGCIASDSIFVFVDTDPRIFVPNIFSPNGDNINDSWGIYADPLNISSIERLVIFDRWGNVLSEDSDIASADAQQLWDGRHANGVVSSGVYVYLLELRMTNMAVVRRSGTITVVR